MSSKALRKTKLKGKEPLQPDVCPYCGLELINYKFIDKPAHVARCSEYFNTDKIKKIIDSIKTVSGSELKDIIAVLPKYNFDDKDISNDVTNELINGINFDKLIKETNKEKKKKNKKEGLSSELKAYYETKDNQKFCNECKEQNPVVTFPCCKDVVCLICIHNRITENFDKRLFYIKCNICKYDFNADEMGSLVDQVDDEALRKLYDDKLCSRGDFDYRDQNKKKSSYGSSFFVDDVKRLSEVYKREIRQYSYIKPKIQHLETKFEKMREVNKKENSFYVSILAGILEQVHQYKIKNHQNLNPKKPRLMGELHKLLHDIFHNKTIEYIAVRELFNQKNKNHKECHILFFDGDPYLKRLRDICENNDPTRVEQDCDEMNELLCEKNFFHVSVMGLKMIIALHFQQNYETYGIKEEDVENFIDKHVIRYSTSSAINDTVVEAVCNILQINVFIISFDSNSPYIENKEFDKANSDLSQSFYLIQRMNKYQLLIDTKPDLDIDDFVDDFNTLSDDEDDDDDEDASNSGGNSMNGFQLPFALLIARKMRLFDTLLSSNSSYISLDKLIEESPFSDNPILVIETIHILDKRNIINYNERSNRVEKSKLTVGYNNSKRTLKKSLETAQLILDA